MSNFPTKIDTDLELPAVNDNITEIGGDAINSLRDAVFNIENEIGVGSSGTTGSIASRLGVSINVDGSLKASALTSAGLISLPIYDYHVAGAADIVESKLNLDHKTQDLYNLFLDIQGKAYTSLSFIADTGSKLQPHLDGYIYRHVLSHIDTGFSFKNLKGLNRDNSNSLNLIKNINNDYVAHQKADGTDFGIIDPSSSSVGTVPPSTFAHNASGIYANTTNFSYIPQTANSLQEIVEFIDTSNLYLVGTKFQTLYSNGISRSSRSSGMTNQSFGIPVVPSTKIITYLLNNSATTPVDGIDTGDDLIEFIPDASIVTSGLFDTQFSQIKVGDALNIYYTDGYGNAPYGYNSPEGYAQSVYGDGYGVGSPFFIQTIITSKKALTNSPTRRYVVRVNNKNLFKGKFSAAIYRPLFNNNKYGVLASAQANPPFSSLPSLILGNPRSAQTLGIGFEPDQIDQSHYNLYISFYPNGNPLSSSVKLPAIDISGNKGKTPGSYTIDNVVEATNNSFRSAGFNYRFMAFSNKGEFGIMMTDPYNNASFSIISGSLATDGTYDQSISNAIFPGNIVGVPGIDSNDALGFVASGSATPNYLFSNGGTATPAAAQVPTKIFSPLTRNNYYINGVERERFLPEPYQKLDGYGDSYWDASIIGKTIIPGVRVETTYQVAQDLSTSSLKIGKTLVAIASSIVDSGRFFIKDIQFNICDCDGYGGLTNITVYDSVHNTGSTPYANADIGAKLKIYFGSDSVSFSSENVSDLSPALVPFKRYFEIYVDEDGKSFSHERARINLGATTTINSINLYGETLLKDINIVSVSPKLKGFIYGSITKITIYFYGYTQSTGQYQALLCSYDGNAITASNFGSFVTGKIGEPIKLYDQTNIDYIEIILNFNINWPDFEADKFIDIQLFPSLQLNEEIFIISSVQVDETTNKISNLRDLRQFGNISETQLSNSAIDFINSNAKNLDENGIIKGFYLVLPYNDTSPTFQISGGTALINGKFVQKNAEYINVPILKETLTPYLGEVLNTPIEWILCLNEKSEYEYVMFSDFNELDENYADYNALSLTHERVVYVINPNDNISQPYAVRSGNFRDIVSALIFKNLTPIVSVKATISLDGATGKYILSSAIISELQRYIGAGFSGLSDPFILGKNFLKVEALNQWITKLNNYSYASARASNRFSSCTVKVRSNYTLTNSVGTPLTKIKIKYVGDGGTLSLDNAVIKSNIGFENITLNVTNQIGCRLSGNNISFNNCTINYNFTPSSDYITGQLSNFYGAAIYCNVVSDGYKNINIEKNIFNINGANHFPGICFQGFQVAYVENINIIENKFYNNISGNDKRSVISIISTSTSSPDAVGTKFVNINIRGNVCDKDQMIIVSAVQDGSDLITDAFIPVHFNIKDNICGSICYFMRQEINYATFNNGKILDKGNYLNIKGNTCKYIYSGFASGFINKASGTSSSPSSSIITAQNIYSASVNISNNVCSWIQIGIKSPSTAGYQVPELIVSQNRQMAIASTFLNEFYNGSVPFNNALNIESVTGT